MTSFLPDTNVWLALAINGHPHHRAAVAWLEKVSVRDNVHFCRATQQSLLRLLTTSAVFFPLGADPLNNGEAWAVFDAFLRDRRISVFDLEPMRIDSLWRKFSNLTKPSPKRWMDAYLAAFAIGAGATLVTIDRAYLTLHGGLQVELLPGA